MVTYALSFVERHLIGLFLHILNHHFMVELESISAIQFVDLIKIKSVCPHLSHTFVHIIHDCFREFTHVYLSIFDFL